MAEQDNIDSETDALEHIAKQAKQDGFLHFDGLDDDQVMFHAHVETGKYDAEMQFYRSVKDDLSAHLEDAMRIDFGAKESDCEGASVENATTHAVKFV